MSSEPTLTPKGTATRARIVEAAADLVLARGVGGTSLNDIRAGTGTSKSQLFHYFPGGKSDLVRALADLQSERVLDAQRPFLDTLDTWEAWDAWRNAVVAHYSSQPSWGCPIGAMTSELIGSDPTLAAEVALHMDRWRGYLQAGLTRMLATGRLRADAGPETLALATFASLQGGLLLAQSMQSAKPLQAALDAALAALRSAATPTSDGRPRSMTEFRDQDLNGACFDRVTLQDATFTDVHLNGASMRDIDLSGAQIRGALVNGSRMRGVELVDVEISGEVQNVVVNGVDIAPLVDARLNRRMPERAKMRPEDSHGFREAWEILAQLWEGTVARARTFPESELHRSVDDEWSFIQTLRHLNFASAAWVGRMILGNPYPWHRWDLHWDVSARFRARLPSGWDAIPWDREARPSLEEVLTVRRERQAMVSRVMESLTDDRLAAEVTCTEPGWPQRENFPFKECLRIVLNEEWEHRLYAERDLTALETSGSRLPPPTA